MIPVGDSWEAAPKILSTNALWISESAAKIVPYVTFWVKFWMKMQDTELSESMT